MFVVSGLITYTSSVGATPAISFDDSAPHFPGGGAVFPTQLAISHVL
jgi:hypothetical protein